MNAAEFKRACKMAQSDVDLSDADDSILHGCALPEFKPVVVTIQQVARMIRWHCQMLNGEWDSQELTEMRRILSRRVTMIG